MTRAVAVLAITAAAGATAAACSDDYGLRVIVRHPPAAPIERTVVSVYESSTTRCAQIELGDLSAAQLQAILVAEQAIGDGGGLDGLSRLDRKLVVARGYDASGRLRAAGCTEKEEIAGRDKVEVSTVLAATLSLGAAPAGEPGVTITLTDAEGRSLGRHPISWRVYGPDGAVPAAAASALAPAGEAAWELAVPTCTADSGIARLHPVPPSRVGGYAVELRPSWSPLPNTLLTSFTRAAPELAPVVPNPRVTRPCAVRVAGGTRRLVCLQLTAVGGASIAREYEVAVTGGSAQLVERGQAAADPRAVALFALARGADRDVYAIGDDARISAVFPAAGAPAPVPAPPTPGTVTDALLLPACEAGEVPRLVVRVATLADKRLYAMAPLGGPLADYHGVATELLAQLGIRGPGCVTELRASGEPRRRQGLVVDTSQRVQGESRSSSSLVYECSLQDASRCRVGLPVALAGAGLAPPSALEEPRVTGMFFDASGVVMSSWVVLPSAAGELRLVERERVPAASIPSEVVTGQFDGDGRADLFWDLRNDAQGTTNLQVTYARRIGELRLSSLSGPLDVLVDDVLAGDLTGDGIDELVLAGRRRVEDGNGDVTFAPGLAVVPMNAPIPTAAPGVDPPCP